MIKSIFYIATISVLISCNSNTIIKKPDNLLSKEKMVNILTESYIAKNAKGIKNINNERNVNYLSLIYANQETDSATFNKSLKYYTSDISLHEEILKLVEENINKRLTDLKDARDSLYSTKIDSLKNAQEKILDQNIADLKESKENELNTKIDSITKHQNDLYGKKISKLENTLKDTLKLESNQTKQSFKDSILLKISDLEKVKQDSINRHVETIKQLHQKTVDEKVEKLKKDKKSYIDKKTKEFERKKYR